MKEWLQTAGEVSFEEANNYNTDQIEEGIFQQLIEWNI